MPVADNDVSMTVHVDALPCCMPVLKLMPVADNDVSMTVHVDALPCCMPTTADAHYRGQQSTFMSCIVIQAGLNHCAACVMGSPPACG